MQRLVVSIIVRIPHRAQSSSVASSATRRPSSGRMSGAISSRLRPGSASPSQIRRAMPGTASGRSWARAPSSTMRARSTSRAPTRCRAGGRARHDSAQTPMGTMPAREWRPSSVFSCADSLWSWPGPPIAAQRHPKRDGRRSRASQHRTPGSVRLRITAETKTPECIPYLFGSKTALRSSMSST